MILFIRQKIRIMQTFLFYHSNFQLVNRMDIEGLDFLLTYRCVSRCAHCLYHAGPRIQGVMAADDARSYLEQAGDIQWLSIHGGEPFIYLDHLLEIIEIAHTMDVGEIWVMTNCYWARELNQACDTLKKIQEAGCTHIWIIQ